MQLYSWYYQRKNNRNKEIIAEFFIKKKVYKIE